VFCLFVCWFVFADCCQAKEQYIEQFQDTLNTSVAKSIAGFFAEPIQVGI
jgi:alanine-glyoxylate transaminase/(R)-3-amino-2-methylpropionate-pyruvate transaminase